MRILLLKAISDQGVSGKVMNQTAYGMYMNLADFLPSIAASSNISSQELECLLDGGQH